MQVDSEAPAARREVPPIVAREAGVRPLLARAHALAQRLWRAEPSYPPGPSLKELGRTSAWALAATVLLFAAVSEVRYAPIVDLFPSYVAAHVIDEGHVDHVYHRSAWVYGNDDPLWTQRTAELTGTQIQGPAFVYHPWYLQTMRPLATHMSFAEFQRGALWVSKLCVAIAGFALAWLIGMRSFSGQVLLMLGIGLSSSARYGFELGQNVMLALALSLLAILSWRSRAPLWLGGFFAMLAWMCKPWCAPLVILCALLRGARAAVWTGLSLAVVMLVLPELLLSDVLMRDYHHMTLQMTKLSIGGWNNVSLLSAIERFSYPGWQQHLMSWLPREAWVPFRVTALSLAAGVLGAGGWIVWRRRPASQYVALAFLAFMLVPLGICWTHYFVFALPLGCLCAFGPRHTAQLRVWGVALLAVVWAIQPLCNGADPALLAARYPWRSALPMLTVVGAVLASLWLAPRQDEV